ncbi:hypothetical protein Trichorick_01711 (plasmid) [Candidatus Trichorickettsia mobilis]|uniref:hypothetical protein n=1 Tax=Candidatus Trichorickettsia mobilis TaxID=1346319 RepID=UPI002B25D4B6|nr:hypothetical protein [Candidatus Trichorickettsia mobilis]WPY01791.1 hypothetical protein Trichorick_01711 [Candidatus Trichorickettsia mobilis]
MHKKLRISYDKDPLYRLLFSFRNLINYSLLNLTVPIFFIKSIDTGFETVFLKLIAKKVCGTQEVYNYY